jgi:hypothetical protein
MRPLDQLHYQTGRLVRIFGRLDYGTGNDRWAGKLQGVATDLSGAAVAVLLEAGHELPTLVPVSAVREVRPAGS